jgi:uncharacterized membrane protein
MDSPQDNTSPQWQRWTSILGGSALAAYGLKRRSVGGTAMALVGGYIVYQGTMPFLEEGTTELAVTKTITVNAAAHDVYRFWRDLDKLPLFMRHLRSVAIDTSGRSHWVTRGPAGRNVEWDAIITDEREPHRIAWHSLPGSDVDHEGSVEFRSAPGDRGTEVQVRLLWRPPGGKIGAGIARFFGEHPERQIREDLRRFKMLIETGEIATTVGQPSGRRSVIIRTFEPFDQEQIVA